MSKKRIIVVEDDQDTAKLLKLVLLEAGYEVFMAFDAIMAKSLMVKQACELLILDIAMPAGNGFALAEFAKTQATTHSAPIIFTSASNDIGRRERAQILGAAAYLHKPYDFKQLLATIENCLL